MKKIKLPQNNFEAYEKFDDIINIISPFFKNGGSHKIFDNHIENYISVYGFFQRNICLKCNNSSSIINLEYNQSIPKEFFDCQCNTKFCTTITVNNMFAGSYCFTNHVLHLTDWTHNSETVIVAKKLIPVLFKKLNLKRFRNKNDIRITIGADIEFEQLSSPNTYSPIKPTFTNYMKAEIGIDENAIELRPKPALTPLMLLQNLKSLINNLQVFVSIKGDRFPIGAHIHFGLPMKFRKLNIIMLIVEALDDFLGKNLLALSGKARDKYDELSAFRMKPWGFEYRTLPSSFLINPRTTYIIFKTAYNVTKKLLTDNVISYKEIPNYKDYKNIAKLSKQEYEAFCNFISSYSTYSGDAINQFWTFQSLF